jgi:hypothetical protein
MVLDVRGQFPGATLADLYDPLAMPPALVKAHGQLDRAVDVCYRPQPFSNERQRVEYLFGLYEQLTAPLLPVSKPKRPRRRLDSVPPLINPPFRGDAAREGDLNAFSAFSMGDQRPRRGLIPKAED